MKSKLEVYKLCAKGIKKALKKTKCKTWKELSHYLYQHGGGLEVDYRTLSRMSEASIKYLELSRVYAIFEACDMTFGEVFNG